MEQIKSSNEIIYKVKNIKSCFNIFNNAVPFSPKRKSDDITEKQKYFSFLNNTNSNKETVDSTHSKNNNIKQLPKINEENSKKKRISIKFQDLLVESNKSEDSENHLELALLIKKRKFPTHKKIRIFECHDINIDNNNEDKEIINNSKIKKNQSMNKVILGNKKNENKFIKKIRRKLFCC